MAAAMLDERQRREKEAINKLTNIESQRIMAVLNNTATNLHILSMLGAFLEASDEITDIAGPDLVRLIQNHANLESRYNRLTEGRSAASKSRRTAIDQELAETRKQLSSSVRHVCRAVKEFPELVERAVTGFVGDRTPGLVTLTKCVDELCDVTYENLTTTVEEEQSRKDELTSITSRAQKATEEMVKLEEALAKARRIHREEIDARKKTRSELQTTLTKITTDSAEAIKSMESDWKHREGKDKNNYAKQEAEYRQQIEIKSKELRELQAANQKLEREWLKRKDETETRLEEKIHKYDETMIAQQSEVEKRAEAYREQKGKLDDKRRRYNVLIEEYNAIAADAASRKAQHDREAEELARMAVAATKIAASWRMYVARKDFVALMKKRNRRRGRRGRGRGRR